MYKSNFVPNVSFQVSELRVYDTSFLSDYAINAAGHIRSDFAVLNETNDRLASARLLQRVEEYSNLDVNKGKDLDQILSEIRPRMCETPAERDRFEQYCLDNAIDFYKKLQDSKVAKLAVGPGDSPQPAESADAPAVPATT